MILTQIKNTHSLIRIHGGPVSQYGVRFSMEWQIFASNGYLVLAINPRGSSGRGEEFQKQFMQIGAM